MKTLKNLFILDCMKGSTILAGKDGLDRDVGFAKVSDTPDIRNYLKEDYLLLTTAYAFMDDTDQLCALIKQMHEINCTGILIKIDRFLKTLPTPVKELADELDFPIINLHPSQTLGDVSRHILNYLNDHELEQLYYALHVHEKFSEMMFNGYNLSYLVEQLGLFLRRPTILLNHRAELIAHSHGFNRDSLKQMEEEIVQDIKQDLTNAREGKVFNIPSNIDKAVTIFPIKTLRELNSMLIIIDSSTIPYPSSKIAMEQAGNVISFTMIKEEAIKENTRIIRNNFFADLIDHRFHSEKEIVSRANFYGLKEEMKSVCITCTIDLQENNFESHLMYERKVGELYSSLYEQLEDEIVSADINAALFTKETYFVILLQFNEYTQVEMRKVKQFIKTAQQHIDIEYPVSFGISNPIKTLSDISTAYYESVDALFNGYDLGKKGFLNFYKAREIEELLSILPEKDLKALYENTLKSLAYPETGEDLDLMETIETYLDLQCNISETARKLFIHRNTVKYRIEKTETLIGRSLEDPDDTLRVRIALVIGSILNENKKTIKKTV